MVMVTSLNFTGRDILKCLSSKRPTCTEESEDHNLGQSPSSLKILSLKNNISHSPVRADVLREVVYHNSLIAVSHQCHIRKCHCEMSQIGLSKGDSNITVRTRKMLIRLLSHMGMLLPVS